jgi:DNA-binding Lrp family transcriptional regulator
MVARAFVLIDALPSKEKAVFESLGKVPEIISKRLLTQRVGQGDIIVLLQAPDTDGLERLITNQLRSVPNVHTIIRVLPHATLLGPVRALMDEMAREVEARGKV